MPTAGLDCANNTNVNIKASEISIQVRYLSSYACQISTVRSERRPARYPCSCRLQYLLVAMPAQADGVECEKGAAICGTSDLPTTDTHVLPCVAKEVAKLLFDFEVRKGF